MRVAAACLLAVACAALAQTPSGVVSPAGGSALDTYRNDALRLSYSYPANFVDASSMVGPAFEATVGKDPAAEPMAKCLSLPFSRMASGTGKLSLLLLVRADAGCLKRKFTAKSVTELAQGEALGLAAAGAKTNFSSPLQFQVATRPAALVRGSFKLPTGQNLQVMVVCVLDEPDIACWQFLADTSTELGTLSALPVTFQGTQPQPLVPSSVLMQR